MLLEIAALITFLTDLQQTDSFGAVSSRLQMPLQLQSHLAAASDDVRSSGAKHDTPHSSWGDALPPKHKHLLGGLDHRDSVMCPNPFLHCRAGQSDQSQHKSQLHQPAAPKQHLSETTSVPASGAAGYLTGAGLLGSASQTHHQLQSAHARVQPPLERLGIQQLQELLGMGVLSKKPQQPRKTHLHDGQGNTALPTSKMLLPQKRQPLQHSFPAAAFADHSTSTAPGQLPGCHSLSESQSALWSQATAMGAFTSQRASLTGMHTHRMSASGLPQERSEALPQPQTAFLRPFQTALHGAPTSSQAVATLPHQMSPHRLDLVSSSEQLSPGTGPSMTVPLRPNRWHNLPTQASSTDLSPGTVPGLNRAPLQSQPLQSKHLPSALSSIQSNSVEEPQWFEGPEAMRKAALVLNAQLAHIDKQVLEHIVPRCGHESKGGHGCTGAHIIQTQVLPPATINACKRSKL